MTEQKIVFLDRDTIGPGVEFPKPSFKHHWVNYDKTRAGDTFRKAKDASIIITNKVEFDFELIKKLPQIKHIAIAATGTNCVDLAAAKVLNVSVSNVPGYATQSVTEHVFSMMLSLRRNLSSYQRDIVIGKWQASQQFCFYNDPIHDLAGSTLGLIGTGVIAQSVARVAEAFGMKVIFHSVSGRQNFAGQLVSFEELLTQSDIVSVHCPLNEKTENLLNGDAMNKMKPSALLINTARGKIVDLDALRLILQRKGIAGAGIDVAPTEPPLKSESIMYLNQMHNCVVTPHTAWASVEAMQVLANEIVLNLEAFVKGEERNIVN